MHSSKNMGSATPTANPNVNHRLWVIMMAHVGSPIVTALLLWWGMLTVGEAVRGVGEGQIWKLLSAQLCTGPKAALKNEVFKRGGNTRVRAPPKKSN